MRTSPKQYAEYSTMSDPKFDAIRRRLSRLLAGRSLPANQDGIADAIDAAEAAYMAKCAEVDRRYLFAGWLQSGHPYYVETTATYEDMDNEVARLRARVAELERRNHKLDMENMELEKEIRRLQPND